MEEALVGQTLLGKLRVVRSIGEGASGVVYEVEHLLTKHRRALKVLRADLAQSGEAVARLVREAGAAGRVESPFVAETFDVGRLPDGAPYVLMELLQGRSLRAELDRRGRLSPAEAARLGAIVCQGLEAVHAAGIVHRDLKPENVFLTGPASGSSESSLKIVDFGVMRPDGGQDTFGRLTRGGALTGTPLYMAPEQLEGRDADARADLYAVGVILFEAVAGRRPFEAEDAASLLAAVTSGAHPALTARAPDAGAALEAVVHRAMHKDPEQRFASAGELRAALEPLGHDAAPAGFTPPLPPSSPLVERFAFVRAIKSGGMGAVYEVVHRETGRRRALKLMLPGAVGSHELRARFRLEARVAAGIDAEHVVDVVDAGVDPVTNTPFLVMELLEGDDLGALLARRGRLDAPEAIAHLAQVGEALDKVHAAGVVHRDLKPENLFVARRDDGGGHIKILDFGIAKVIADGACTNVATVGPLGTPLYMAPEQLDAEATVGPAADLAALGHIAFALLTGEPYWAREAKAGAMVLLAEVARGPREPASARAARLGVALSPSFDAWFAKATAREPASRFATAGEQIRALAEALAEPACSTLAAVEHSAPTPRRARPRGLALGLVAAAAAGLLAVGAWAARPRSTTAPPEVRAAAPPVSAATAPREPEPPPAASASASTAAPAPPVASSKPRKAPARPVPRAVAAASAAPAPPPPPPTPAHDSVF